MSGRPRRLREPTIDWLGRETFINLTLLSRRFGDDVEKLCRDERLTMSHYVVLWVVMPLDEDRALPRRRVAELEPFADEETREPSTPQRPPPFA